MESLITTKPLTTSVINKKMQQLDCFVGTYARDMLPMKLDQSTAALVINTDPSHKPGQHWVAVYIADGHGEYFDSFGLLPLTSDIFDFLYVNCPKGWSYNPVTLQTPHRLSETCGSYCVLYLKYRCRGYSYCQFISQFSKFNTVANDVLVDHIVNQ
jgi:hypothetical protein